MSPCDYCELRYGCDWLSELCVLTPRQVVTLRSDLILNAKKTPAERKTQRALNRARARQAARQKVKAASPWRDEQIKLDIVAILEKLRDNEC